MIETEAIDQTGIVIVCPHCRETLLTLYLHEPKEAFDRYVYMDGDGRSELTPRPPRRGWDVEVRLGVCTFCAGVYFGITAKFIDAMLEVENVAVYFFRKGDRGAESNFIGRRGEETWLITRFDTPLGPMLEHQFGPFAVALRSCPGKWCSSGEASGSRRALFIAP